MFDKFIVFFKDLFMLRYLPQLGNNTSYAAIFIFGILTSFHCIAMCGGFTISQISGKEDNIKSKIEKCIIYNLFRIISYTVLGAVAGGLGNIIRFTGAMNGIVPIMGGIFMIITAINLFGTFKFIRKFNVRIPTPIIRYIRNRKNHSPVFLGIISAFMPCAPLQIVQIYALGTGNILFGAIAMFVFTIGTVPLLLAFGVVNSAINKRYSNKITKLSAGLVLFLGISLINRGLMYFDVTFKNPISEQVNINSEEYYKSVVKGDKQTVITELKKNKFPKIQVYNNIHVVWMINVKKENLNECNNEIVIRSLSISQKLKVGENIIEFTPKEEGEFNYTCWMNMIKSEIKVVK